MYAWMGGWASPFPGAKGIKLMSKASFPLPGTSIFAEGLDHPECVAIHPDGSVWAGGEGGQIYRIAPDGKKMEIVAKTGGFVLGLAFSPDASWLAICDIKKGSLWSLDLKSGRLRERMGGMSIPNFPVFTRDGRLFVSDSGSFKKNCGKIHILPPGKNAQGTIWHPGPIFFANGLALSGDEKTLYVAASLLPGIERIQIRADGSAGRRSVFVRLPRSVPDGLAFDAPGNLYVGCYAPNAIYRISPSGKASVFMDDWFGHTFSNPTNLAFRGRELFVANLGRWHLTRMKMKVAGAPLACFPLR